MKIEMPKEPDVDRLWARESITGEVLEWRRVEGAWANEKSDVQYSWTYLLGVGPVYTTHPDHAALEKYPAPWKASPAGTVRDATGKAVLDPTLQCPPCLTALIVRAVNELAERNVAASNPQTEDEKK